MSEQQYAEFGKLVFEKMSNFDQFTSNTNDVGEFTIEAMHTIEAISEEYKNLNKSIT